MLINLTEAQLDAFAANGLLQIDNFLADDFANSLLQDAKYWKKQEAFKQAGIGKLEQLVIKESYRSDKIKWINRNECLPDTKAYIAVLDDLVKQLNRSFFLSLKDYECMYAIYPAGAFYKKHTDRFKQQAHRVVSSVLYLNENWDDEFGGQLKVYLDDETLTINPIFNRLVLFKSELWHEVLPCTQERYSITGWMKDQLNEVYFL